MGVSSGCMVHDCIYSLTSGTCFTWAPYSCIHLILCSRLGRAVIKGHITHSGIPVMDEYP